MIKNKIDHNKEEPEKDTTAPLYYGQNPLLYIILQF